MTTNYTTLKADIAEYLDRDDLTARIPSLISLGEDRIYRDLMKAISDSSLSDKSLISIGQARTVTSTMTISDPYISLPSRLTKIKSFHITVSSNQTKLASRTDDFIDDYWPNVATQGQPKYYSRLDDDALKVAPTPDAAYPFKLKYYEHPEALSVSNTTNWFTDNHPSILLYASLLEATPYLKNDSRIPTWVTAYSDCLAAVVENLKQYAKDDNS